MDTYSYLDMYCLFYQRKTMNAENKTYLHIQLSIFPCILEVHSQFSCSMSKHGLIRKIRPLNRHYFSIFTFDNSKNYPCRTDNHIIFFQLNNCSSCYINYQLPPYVKLISFLIILSSIEFSQYYF